MTEKCSAKGQPQPQPRKLTAYIDDGFTITETIESDGRFYPDTEITFRPLTRKQMSGHVRDINGINGDGNDADAKREEIVSDLMERHIFGWGIKDSKGEPVKISAENYHNIERHLQAKIYTKVCQFEENVEGPQKNSEAG